MNLRIARDTLNFILEVSKSSHPNEWIGLLREENGVIRDVLFLPGTESSETSASIRLDMLPLGISVAGSVHSHPFPGGPSPEDLHLFSRKRWINIIVWYPYDKNSWACYDPTGKRIELPVIDVGEDEESSGDWDI
jgi:proteasome lid subunit RPN8/RPN11